MANNIPISAMISAYGVNPAECIFITKQDGGNKLRGIIPKGMKVLRYNRMWKYNLDNIEAIPDDESIARQIRDNLIFEAKNW